MDYILVGIGGIFGSMTRYGLGRCISKYAKSKFPIGTFIINITGALLLGILTGAKVPNAFYALLGDGFLGAYTTFSTFMYEGFNLFDGNKKLNAAFYILSSVIIGIVGFEAGLAAGKII